MILVSATLTFASQADRDAAVAKCAPIQAATRAEEEGCISYCFAADPCVPTAIQVYESWTSEDALSSHFEHPTYARMVEALHSCSIVNSENQKYLVEKRSPVYTEDGTPAPRLGS